MKGQQQGGQNTSMDFLWICVGLVLGVGLLWYNFKVEIVQTIFAIRTFEAQIVMWLVTPIVWVTRHLHLPVPDFSDLEDALQFVKTAPPANVTFQQVTHVSHEIGQYLAVPLLFITLPMAAYLIFFHRGTRFKAVYTMKSLRKSEVVNWHAIAPVVDVDLVNTSINEGPMAMSEPPLRFGLNHQILEHYTKDGRPAVKVIPGAAERVFSLQMGPLWIGLEELPKHVQALFAIFAAKAEQDIDAAEKLLDQLSRSARGGKIDYSGVRQLLIKHVRSRSVGRAVSPHGYVLTVMASMLELARTAGVMATAEFLWLKQIDRRLWYMLCSVGRQTPFPEVAGPFGHWIVEKRLRRPLKVPVVHQAVVALEEALEDIIYNPDEV